MVRKNLFNMTRTSELAKLVEGLFLTLERGEDEFEFRDRVHEARTNAFGRKFIDVPGYLTTTFRVYEMDKRGKSLVMFIIKDLFADSDRIGSDGEPQTENPVLYGNAARNRSRGVSIYFWNDERPREVEQRVLEDISSRFGISMEELETKPAPMAPPTGATPPTGSGKPPEGPCIPTTRTPRTTLAHLSNLPGALPPMNSSNASSGLTPPTSAMLRESSQAV
jgi:hypothetical protein